VLTPSPSSPSITTCSASCPAWVVSLTPIKLTGQYFPNFIKNVNKKIVFFKKSLKKHNLRL
jgi:hypothetical protein